MCLTHLPILSQEAIGEGDTIDDFDTFVLVTMSKEMEVNHK